MIDVMKDYIDEEGRIITYKNTLLFAPPKNKRSSLKGKGKGKKNIKSTESLSSLKKEKTAKFEEKQPQKLNSKSQFVKEKRKEKQYKSAKEIVHAKRRITKERKSTLATQCEIPLEEVQEKKVLDDFELNDLPYEEAVKLDQRTWFKTYISLLKREHLIIFTFFVCHDYNMFVVKMSRFIFLLATDMAMNVFFFSDVTMHKIFLDYGKYNFVQQIPQVLYSSIVTQIIEILLCFLSLTDTHMYEIKNLEFNEKNKKVIMDIFDTIKRKLFFYWLFTFIMFLGYWYVVACFCAVYPNTQIIFIKDSLVSFLLNQIFPFIIYSVPSAFRKCSIRCKNNSCLYKFSDFIPIF